MQPKMSSLTQSTPSLTDSFKITTQHYGRNFHFRCQRSPRRVRTFPVFKDVESTFPFLKTSPLFLLLKHKRSYHMLTHYLRRVRTRTEQPSAISYNSILYSQYSPLVPALHRCNTTTIFTFHFFRFLRIINRI